MISVKRVNPIPIAGTEAYFPPLEPGDMPMIAYGGL